jgi:hypothetical protein
MKLKSLHTIASTLEEAGYTTTRDETAVFVDLHHDGKPYPAVLQLQEDALHVTCQLGKLSDFDQDQLSLVAINALAANVEMLPYAFAIIKPTGSADEDTVADSPLVLINSVPVEDLSEDEVLWDLQKLQSALIAGLAAISTAASAGHAG